MIAYSNPTYLDIMDEVLYRLGKHRTPENIDTETLLRIVSRSVQSLYCKLLPYKDWAMRTQINVQNGSWLSENLLSIERVLVSPNGQPPYREARKAEPREFYTVTASQGWQQWNRATLDRPIYTVYNNTIYFAPTITPANEDPTDSNNVGLVGIVDCYLVPTKELNMNNPIPLPGEFEELLILECMQRFLFKTSDKSQLYSIIGQINSVEEMTNNTYTRHKVTQKQTLDSFVSQFEQPFTPPTFVEGELPKRLV